MSERSIHEENVSLKREVEKANIFKNMIRQLVSDASGIKEFSNRQTIYGELARLFSELTELRKQNEKLQSENARLHNLVHTPHTSDFMEAVPLEAAFQIDHWGNEHDEGKTPLDWFWLVGYLSQKIVVSIDKNDIEKAKHHCVSTAATMLNWYRRLVGDDNLFRPGIGEPSEIKFEGKK